MLKSTLCCLCNFPIDPRAKNGSAEHDFKAEHLFLENIHSEKQMVRMRIDKFQDFSEKLNKILDQLDPFCASIESENIFSKNNPDINEIVDQIKKIKTTKEDEGKATKEKTIGFVYSHAIKFLLTNKVKGDFPMSEKILSNTIVIAKNDKVIHHSHVTCKIIGYAHNFCNLRCKKNYFTIPLLAHNRFRFEFLKGIRPSVWETSHIAIGGRNPTDVNFAITRNQVRFINTIKFFQQSLGSLADSITNKERETFAENV